MAAATDDGTVAFAHCLGEGVTLATPVALPREVGVVGEQRLDGAEVSAAAGATSFDVRVSRLGLALLLDRLGPEMHERGTMRANHESGSYHRKCVGMRVAAVLAGVGPLHLLGALAVVVQLSSFRQGAELVALRALVLELLLGSCLPLGSCARGSRGGA